MKLRMSGMTRRRTASLGVAAAALAATLVGMTGSFPWDSAN